MVIRGRAPLRVSFGGGGTDVAPFCVEQGGAIIGSTINKYAYCSIMLTVQSCPERITRLWFIPWILI